MLDMKISALQAPSQRFFSVNSIPILSSSVSKKDSPTKVHKQNFAIIKIKLCFQLSYHSRPLISIDLASTY